MQKEVSLFRTLVDNQPSNRFSFGVLGRSLLLENDRFYLIYVLRKYRQLIYPRSKLHSLYYEYIGCL